MARCGTSWDNSPTPGYKSCIGVYGYKPFADDPLAYNTFMRRINSVDTNPICGATGDTSLPQVDLYGQCSGTANTPGLASRKQFHIGHTEIDSVKNDNIGKIGLTALHKKWGASGDWDNNGVSKNNVHYLDNEIVEYKGQRKTGQTVFALDIHGDKYTGGVTGVKRGKQIPSKDKPVCPNWVDSESGKRCGACLATMDNYGPGRYSVLAMVPKTESPDTRGYVFAIWSYSYMEVYPPHKNSGIPPSSQYIDKPVEFQVANCFKCDPSDPSCNREIQVDPSLCKDIPRCTAPKGAESWWECFTNHNSEIDIEIPANSPQFKSEPIKLGWNTMNANTWIADNEMYGADDPAFYRQTQVTKNDGLFISENGEYHLYEYDWRQEPDGSYSVYFYFDGDLVHVQKAFAP